MAIVFPSDIPTERIDRFENDEYETLLMLQEGLPPEYSVYHNVHWSKAAPKATAFGEIDFVVINPAGHVLVIEQKNGPLVETPQGLEKHYGMDKKLVSSQVQRNLSNFRDKFKKLNPQSPPLIVDYLIYCPEYRVVDVNAAGVDMQRTVDARAKTSLAARIEELMTSERDENPYLCEEIHNYLCNSFRIVPDVNAYKANQRKVYRRLLSGLSDVIESLEFEPYKLRVIGTAGSGKTQVTMRFCERAVEAGKSPLLVCFNRPLADKLVALAPEGVSVNTYYGFVREMAESAGVEIDFSNADQPGFWRGIQDELLAATHTELPKYDCLVVDEGQDFKADWYEMLSFFLTDDATQLWLEDPLQNLREMDAVELPGFVTYRESANFRTPSSIAGFIKATLDSEFEQRNALPGLGVALYEYETPAELNRVLDSRVNELLKVGFQPADIAIISCRGMKSTVLSDVDQLGKLKVRRFTGEYNARDEQIYTDGELYFDTIFRFKGQQAAAVILVDLDETIEKNDWATGILYCAMTRATVRLELVVHQACPWLPAFRANIDE